MSETQTSSTSQAESAKDEVIVGKVFAVSMASLALIVLFTGAMVGVAQFLPDYYASRFLEANIPELKTLPAPSEEQLRGSDPWTNPEVLVFGQGWAQYRVSSSGHELFQPDIAVLKTHDGRWFMSRYAFGASVIRVRPEQTQPVTFDAYIGRFSRHGWIAIPTPQ